MFAILAAEEIREVELWDLVSAFGRIVRDSQAARPSNIVYDDTPIHVYMAEIQARLLQQGQLTFRELFRPGMHRSALVGIFLAVLELVRHERVRTEQNDLFGEIWILPGQSADNAARRRSNRQLRPWPGAGRRIRAEHHRSE